MKTGTYINSAKITSVNIGSVVQAQPKYGVVPVHIQPKYGVAVPPTGSTGTICLVLVVFQFNLLMVFK